MKFFIINFIWFLLFFSLKFSSLYVCVIVLKQCRISVYKIFYIEFIMTHTAYTHANSIHDCYHYDPTISWYITDFHPNRIVNGEKFVGSFQKKREFFSLPFIWNEFIHMSNFHFFHLFWFICFLFISMDFYIILGISS